MKHVLPILLFSLIAATAFALGTSIANDEREELTRLAENPDALILGGKVGHQFGGEELTSKDLSSDFDADDCERRKKLIHDHFRHKAAHFLYWKKREEGGQFCGKNRFFGLGPPEFDIAIDPSSKLECYRTTTLGRMSDFILVRGDLKLKLTCKEPRPKSIEAGGSEVKEAELTEGAK